MALTRAKRIHRLTSWRIWSGRPGDPLPFAAWLNRAKLGAMRILLHLALLTATVLLSARYIAGVRIKSVPAALGVAVLFSGLNWLLGGLIKVLLFLPAILTLGLLFLVLPLIVNVILLWVTDKLLHVFEIEDAKSLWLMAIFVTIANGLAHFLIRF
jgi:putative membrane protein